MMPKLFRISVLLLVAYNIQGVSANLQRHSFQLLNYCKVDISPYDIISMLKTRLHCAVRCSRSSQCAAYLFDQTNGCKVFGNGIRSQTVCETLEDAEMDVTSIRAYVKTDTCKNGGILKTDGTCQCYDGYVGQFCERLMEDCSEGYDVGGYLADQKYWIQPTLAPYPFQVLCQMSEGIGITKIQTLKTTNVSFNRTWNEYKEGFEINPETDFWLGNDKIHWITKSYPHTMVVQLNVSGNKHQRYHSSFVMANEANDYAVTYFSSRPPNDPSKFLDECWPGTSIKFSTYDRDNDGNSQVNCAQYHGAGFWYQSGLVCTECNPNGNLNSGLALLNNPDENFWKSTLLSLSPSSVWMVLVR